jgi:two-component system cell cycle response regulator
MSVTNASCPVGESTCPYIGEVQELRQQVITDPLTGLFNVRHFRASLDHELERTRRTGMVTALIMIDLDHFKRINDEYGHENGNRVLEAVAELLNQQTRRLDICCRYGGEEFAVILPSTELMLAKQVAERFRQALESMSIELSEGYIQVTASLGIAMADQREEITGEALVALADACLYESKSQGRNRVTVHRPKPSESRVSSDEKDALRNLFSND